MTPPQEREQRARVWLENQGLLVIYGDVRALVALLADTEAAVRKETLWPIVIAPAQYENPAPGWEDPKLPDFKLIWKLAREVGYAVGIHGSLKRDVDLIAAPWTDEAVGNYELIEQLCNGLPAKWLGYGEAPCNLAKPHGRVAVTLQLEGYYKPIDLSIMPRQKAYQAQAAKEGT